MFILYMRKLNHSPRLEVLGKAAGSRRPSFGNEEEEEEDDGDDSPALEPLNLPPTKLHKKQLKLLKRSVMFLSFFGISTRHR